MKLHVECDNCGTILPMKQECLSLAPPTGWLILSATMTQGAALLYSAIVACSRECAQAIMEEKSKDLEGWREVTENGLGLLEIENGEVKAYEVTCFGYVYYNVHATSRSVARRIVKAEIHKCPFNSFLCRSCLKPVNISDQLQTYRFEMRANILYNDGSIRSVTEFVVACSSTCAEDILQKDIARTSKDVKTITITV